MFFQISQITPRIAIVIPARLDSKRFPRKALLDIQGLPMVEHVRRRGEMNSHNVPVYVVSGDEEILTTIENFGGSTLKTLNEHLNGLSRVYEASDTWDFTHYIVLQGDEVLVLPSQLDSLIKEIKNRPNIDFWNLISSITSQNELDDTSVVKCLLNHRDEIFSIFRGKPLTTSIDMQMKMIYKICGLFAVSSEALKIICTYPATQIEIHESIEQMKYIEIGQSIQAIKTEYSFTSINLPVDYSSVLLSLEKSEIQKQILRQTLDDDQ